MKLLVATTLMIFAIPAFAATDASEAARLVADAKITLSQAITTAQANVPGSAVNAELDRHFGKTVYEVEILSPEARLYDVRLNAVDGSVISIKEDIN